MTKPCPFCGMVDDHTDRCYFTLKVEGATIGELSAAWNRRATPSPSTAPTVAEHAMEAEIAELSSRAAAGQGPADLLPLDQHTRFILGRPNYTCIRAADRMRELGHDIDRKAEAEQAAVLHLMLTMYLKHGEKWQERCNEYLQQKTRFD